MLARGSLLLLGSSLLTACSAPPPASPAPAVTRSSNATGGDAARCLASIASKRTPGWTERGRIDVALEDGQPTSMTALDAGGAVVTTRPAPKSKSDARAALEELTCRLGGVLAALEGADAAGASRGAATASFVVLAPAVVDEKADLLTLCAQPEEQTAGPKPRLTFDQLEQRLTSPRWRGWLFDLADEHERTTGSDRMMLHWRKADELGDAARRAGVGRCWFEAQLRSPNG